MSFSADIEGFAKRAGLSVDQAMRGTVLELFGKIIEDTPAETGRARGNWQTTIGTPASGTVERMGESGALAEMNAVTAQFSGDKTIYLTNNLPYIWKLEYGGYGTGPGATEKTGGTGFSIQAPEGMVRKNVARIQQIVAKEARANKI